MEVPLIVAWKDLPVQSCYPDCHSIEDNLRAPSRAHAIKLILEDFELEPESSGWNGSRFVKARVLPR